jgi:hypothetical protein
MVGGGETLLTRLIGRGGKTGDDHGGALIARRPPLRALREEWTRSHAKLSHVEM